MGADPVVPLSVSERTRAALAQAKARGVVLGSAGARNLQTTLARRTAAADAFASSVRPVFAEFQAQGLTHREMAAELNRRGIAAARGGEWTHGQVQRMINRLTP